MGRIGPVGTIATMSASFSASFQEAALRLDEFRNDPEVMSRLDHVAGLTRDALKNGQKILVCGNGGSLADAMHFAEEWTGRFRTERRPYPVLALADPTHMSCVANDYGFDQVFSRGVEAFGAPGDLLFLLSTSGESENLVVAAKSAKNKGVQTIGFLGRGGGKLAQHCDVVVIAPGSTSDRIQEIHMMSLHTLIEVVEQMLTL